VTSSRLADLTWLEARDAFARDPVVVIPLGGGAKEHGPHLRLDTDLRQAEAFAALLLERCARERVESVEMVVAPSLTYGFYPAFVEYPGSTHIREETMRDLVVDVVRSIARHGPRKFYVVNIGVSTVKPLTAARDMLRDVAQLAWFDYGAPEVRDIDEAVRAQQEGSHADELETSILLALDESRVDMSKAVREYGPGRAPRGPFSPHAVGARPSPSGVYGDATLASVDKGRVLIEGYVRVMREQIRTLASTPAST
jgi:creatinine amidohydrolase